MYGTDENEYDVPVIAASFVLKNAPDNTPEPPPDCQCTEDPNNPIVGQLNADGAIFADYGALAPNLSFIPSVCGSDPFSIASSLSPTV